LSANDYDILLHGATTTEQSRATQCRRTC
jgi:hypothetical protein